MESFYKYLHGNIFTSYSIDIHGDHHQAWCHWKEVDCQNCQFSFTIYYLSGNSSVDADALSQIPWDHMIKAEAVKAIFKATVEGPDVLMKVYACHEKAISSLILQTPPTWMTNRLGPGPESRPSLVILVITDHFPWYANLL